MTNSKSTKSKYIHLVVMLVLAFAVGALPTFGQVTPAGMKAIGVFVAVLYGWIFFDLLWPSVFGFVMIGIMGIQAPIAAFSSAMGNMSLLMLLASMLFAGAMEEAKLTKFLAYWLLKKPIFQKSPWFLVVGFVVVAYVLGAFQASIAAVFLLWAVVMEIAKACDFKEKDPFISFLLLMICMTAISAGLTLPFSGGAIPYLGFYTQAMGTTIPQDSFIVFAIAITAAADVLMILAARFIFKFDASKFKMPESVLKEIESNKATKKEKICAVILFAYMAALLLPIIAPTAPGMGLLTMLGLVGVTFITLAVMAIIEVDGKPLIDLKATFIKHIQWPLLMLYAVTFPIAASLQAEEAGVMATLTGVISPLVNGLGVVPFMIASMILVGVITQLSHNLIVAAIMVPILCPILAGMGGNAALLWFMIYLVCNCAYVTPAASMQSAMCHGNGDLDSKWAYILGIVFLAIYWIVFIVIGIPLGNMLFPV